VLKNGRPATQGQCPVCGTLLKHSDGTCTTPYLNARKFEKLVIEKIKERILTEDNLRDLVRLVNEEMDAAAIEYRKCLDTIAAELEDVNRRLERLYDSLETGKLSINDLAPRIQSLRHHQDQLEATREEILELQAGPRAELADIELLVKCVEDLRNLLAQGSLAEQKAFIHSFVKAITVADSEMVLTYTIPLPPEGILQERAGVLPIIQPGSGGWFRTNQLRSAGPMPRPRADLQSYWCPQIPQPINFAYCSNWTNTWL